MIKYFAKLGLNSKVIEVCTVHENNAPTEKQGIDFHNLQSNASVIFQK